MLGKLVGRCAIVLTIGASAVVATQAPASAAWNWCVEGKLCFATGLNGEGTRWSYALSEVGGGMQLNTAQRNQISSVWNRTGVGADVYDNPDCVSRHTETLPPIVYSWQNIWIDGPKNLNEFEYDSYFLNTWDNRVQSFSTWGPEWPDGTRCAKRIP